jgi:hypothetical protein
MQFLEIADHVLVGGFDWIPSVFNIVTHQRADLMI